MIASNSHDSSLRGTIRVLSRHRGKALLFFFVVLGAGTAITLVMPKTYRSEGMLLLRLGRENMAVDPTATIGSAPVLTSLQPRENETNTVIEIIRSTGMMEKVVDALGPATIVGTAEPESEAAGSPQDAATRLKRDNAVRRLSRQIDVEAVRKSNVVQISCGASKPELAQAIVNKLIEIYLEEHVRLNRTPGAQEFLAEQTGKIRDRLQAKEEQLRKLQDETALAEPQGRRSIVTTRIGRLEDELLSVSAGLSSTEAEVKRLQEQLKTLPVTEVTEATAGFPNEAADGMRNQLYTLQLKEQELATKFTEDHPQLQQVRRQIADAQNVLDKEQPARTQTRTSVSKPHEEVKLELLKLEPVLAALRAKSARLESQLNGELADQKKLNSDEVSVARLEREVQIEEANYKKYSESLEQARIDSAMAQQGKSNISIVQPATLDLQPVKPKVMFNIALAFVIGAIGGVGLAFVAESFRNSAAQADGAHHEFDTSSIASQRRVEVNGIR